MENATIYLDYNSTTPVDPQVLEKMIPFFNKYHGNASSVTHEIGKEAKKSFQNAKSIIARGLNCTPEEIIITSGATESLNLAIKGLVYSSGSSNKHILTLKTEPENIEDDYAVELRFEGTMIGHIPRSDNKHIFRLLDQGKDLVCTIREIDPDAETWQMCKVKVEMVA